MKFTDPLPTPDEMALWDQTTIRDFGLRQEVLMENAGRAAFSVLEKEFGPVSGKQALVFAGSGNNGGDAFVVARLLAGGGANVLVLHARQKKRYAGATAYNLRLVRKLNLSCAYLPGRDLNSPPKPDIIVDGLLGTGFQGNLREDYEAWVRAINRLGKEAFVLSLDIPSGLDGLTGVPCPIAVRADVTATFEAAKLGLAMPLAKEFTGQVRVCGIGIPETIKEKHPAECGLLTRAVAKLLPLPDPDMHKGGAGHVLVVGGSLGLTGAPLLAALGALRCGCGLATVACPGKLAAEVKAANPDVMTWPLGDKETWSELLADVIKERLPQFQAVLIGPGLGRGPGAQKFLTALLAMQLPKTILDADALYWLAQDKSLFEKIGRDVLLTPHPGEMARLTGKTTPEVQEDRLALARAYAREKNIILILKGPGTVIAHPSGNTFLSPFTIPNLAVGGSGDVLAGILAGLTAQGLSPLDAACLGVYWHGRAGEILESEYPYRGNLASEIPHILPEGLKDLRHT